MVASVALHFALIISGPRSLLPFGEDEAYGPPLTAEIAGSAPALAAAKAAAKPAPSRPRRVPRKTPAAEPAPAPPPGPVLPQAEESPAPEPEEQVSAAAPLLPPEPLPEQTLPEVQLPARAELQYVLIKGTQGLRVGKVSHNWQAEGERYRVKSVLEASGPFSLFYSGQLIQESEGTITPQGLRPDTYLIQRGSADETETARFEWETFRLVLGSRNGSRILFLPPYAQDQLSFLHNLPFITPDAGRYRMVIASSRKVDAYEYDVVGEETLETESGLIRAIHLRKRRGAATEGTDVWLAPEHHLLPVKIQITDKSGDTVQQVISRIEIQP